MPSSSPIVISKVLVANRGEIARRIFRTLREMGLASVAVYSDADRDASFVHEADEAVHLGPAPASESYLNQDAVIAAAKAIEAEAIHPGYGFLSENADFAQRCLNEKLIFIGPSPDAIRRMGDKAAAKKLAAEVGVPVIPGFSLDGQDADAIHQQAEEVGYPLLVKAAAGGGGKGMRKLSEPAELSDAITAAAREAEAAFGDGSLLIERWIATPRHVEVQILGDHHGHLVHLLERDCSIQRRHQKVFEECPSPAVDEDLRRQMGEAALDLARAVNYYSAGTVEFLLDADGSFYFLEMNTRLQVEHPVTEAVTGLDLVQLQIEIAQGEALPFEQSDVTQNGHAIEGRLYAEDAANDFLPATGTVNLWSMPERPGLRFDSGVERGDEVTIHYDPMLAKVIAHGQNRAEALRRLRQGLSELAVGGLTTNRDFLLAVLEHDKFCRGDVDTNFLEQHAGLLDRSRSADTQILALHAVAATLSWVVERQRSPGPKPAGVAAGWRNHRWRPQEQVLEHDGQRLTVGYVAKSIDRFAVDVQSGAEEPQTLDVRLIDVRADTLVAEVSGVRRRFQIGSDSHRAHLSVHGQGRVTELTPVSRFPERQASAVAGGCVAPMTGRVVEVPVRQGDTVAAGTTLVVLEAMKMEHRLQAQTYGVVEAVRVRAGQMVDPDEILVVVTPSAESAD